ncbi:RIMS-binding protein 2 isoform X12 [Hippocampus zosterae]|uniref:RIMS-binding protein 2 isoform X12 n=1 Tax=Hippocampus zosterae TaxID=109293 RepID=UPI00223CA46F|nr:RIMS-binding protein 2 isoform X12 [Hippocampus zosterae]
MGCEKTCRLDKLLKHCQRECVVSPGQRLPPAKRSSQMKGTDKLRNKVTPLQLPSVQRLDNLCLLQNSSAALSLNPETLSSPRIKRSLLETEISAKRKECEALEAEVKKKNQTCQTLENELQDFFQENTHLSLRFFNGSHKPSEYERVKSEYAQLKDTLGAVTQERDLALWERNQLQGKLENLEQVLKHMREAAERRQQLEVEHEQALAVLNAKQQEIDLLQKAQVEAKKEHEGAVHLLENHLDSMQAKVRELEEKCRSQSEQFNLLSKELEKFRLQAGFDILSTEPITACESPSSPNKSLSQLLNGLAAPIGKGSDTPASRSLISEFIRPLQTSGDKPELLSVKPTFLTRSRGSSSARTLLSEMDKELGLTTRSKPRFTGKVRLCIARYSYNPYDGPNEHPEAELPLVAGKYLYVYGTMDEDGFYEGELLDGQRGLVPSNFVDFLEEETTSIQHRDSVAKEPGNLNHSSLGPQRLGVSRGMETGLGSLLSDSKEGCLNSGSGSSLGMDLLGSSSNGTGTLDVNIDEVGENIVPYPRRINLIKQLAKSIIIGWDPPVVPPGWGSINGYNVLVDKEIRMSVPYGGRTKSLIEKLNLATNTYRISVQSVTERGLSDELRCTVLVGKDVVVAPYFLRVDNITQSSAELSWMPSNSNYSHTLFLNGAEYDMIKAGGYKYQFFNLKPMTGYKVKVVAQTHQVPWQLPTEQRDKREISVEFCTQTAGPPLPPQEVQVQCGQTPGVLQVRWKPPPLTTAGTSNGASVIGYAVCTKGQKIAEVLYPTADYVTVELNRIECLEAREVIVRTLSTQGESQDSPAAIIPHNLLGSPRLSHRTTGPPHTLPHPPSHPALSQTHPPYPSTYPPIHPQPQVQPLPRAQPHTLPHAQTHSQPICHSSPHANPQLQRQPMPKSKALISAREPETKEHEASIRPAPPWERSPSPLPPMRGPNLEPPAFQTRRSPSPQRILPQPQGVPIPNTIAKAMAREAAQRVFAEGNRGEKRNIFRERGNALHPLNSDEEEDGYDSPHARRKGASVDEFLRGSELGRQHHHHHHHHSGHSEEYYTESSRGSDLSDIMEEDEEDLYSEMQLEEGRRRSINSHNSLKLIGNSPSHGNANRLDHTGRKPVHIGSPPQRRPIPSIEITMDSNSEGSEGNLSPVKEDVYYGSVAGRRLWPSISSEDQYDSYGGRRHGQGRRSLDYFEESEPDELTRVFVALFDYDPLSMSPNPDAADEELPFKEGQVIKVFGNKDTDGFYRAEIRDRVGLIPCNMVSEIQTEDGNMMGQLLKQGFLPLNTPVDKLVNCDRFKDGRAINRRSRKSKRERNRRSGRQHPMTTRRMVALYDYDPRESSPNIDIEPLVFTYSHLSIGTPIPPTQCEGHRLDDEAELTFCAGDVITVFGEIDEDGFYYGELNGHNGLVPSNFLEEVPDDVEVFLTDSPSRYPQDTPSRIKTKRVPGDKWGRPRRAGSPPVHPHILHSHQGPTGHAHLQKDKRTALQRKETGPFGDWNESGVHLTKGYLFRAHLSWTQTNFIGNVRSRHSHDDDDAEIQVL